MSLILTAFSFDKSVDTVGRKLTLVTLGTKELTWRQ